MGIGVGIGIALGIGMSFITAKARKNQHESKVTSSLEQKVAPSNDMKSLSVGNEFSGAVVIVTGGANGIGSGTAIAFAR